MPARMKALLVRFSHISTCCLSNGGISGLRRMASGIWAAAAAVSLLSSARISLLSWSRRAAICSGVAMLNVKRGVSSSSTFVGERSRSSRDGARRRKMGLSGGARRWGSLSDCERVVGRLSLIGGSGPEGYENRRSDQIAIHLRTWIQTTTVSIQTRLTSWREVCMPAPSSPCKCPLNPGQGGISVTTVLLDLMTRRLTAARN